MIKSKSLLIFLNMVLVILWRINGSSFVIRCTLGGQQGNHSLLSLLGVVLHGFLTSFVVVDCFYGAPILIPRADPLCLHVILHKWLVFIMRFWIFTEVVYLQCWHSWCHIKLLLSWSVQYTPYNPNSKHGFTTSFLQKVPGSDVQSVHATMHRRFMQIHICKVHVRYL